MLYNSICRSKLATILINSHHHYNTVVAYHGRAQDMVSYFASIGHACPKNYNPAEFAIDLVSTDFSSQEQGDASYERVQALIQAHKKKSPVPRLPPKTPVTRLLSKKKIKTCGWREQFSLLLKRSWRQTSE